MQRDITCLRNIGIVASVDARTSCRARILSAAGTAPATTISWVPRSGPFTDEATSVTFASGSRAFDGAVLVLDAARGVAESEESAFREIHARGIPALAFIDDVGDVTDFEAIVGSLERELDVDALPIALPWRDESGAHVLDVLEQRLVDFGDRDGERRSRPLPKNARELVLRARRRLLEGCAEMDASLLGASSIGLEVGADEIARALHRAAIARDSRVLVVTCGSLRAERQVPSLLDAIVTYLPSPAETPPVFGTDPHRGVTVARFPRQEDALCASVFATSDDATLGHLAWVRVHSGTLTTGRPLLMLPSETTARVRRIFQPNAGGHEELEEAGAGSIVCVTGLVSVRPGQTVCDARSPVILGERPTVRRAPRVTAPTDTAS